MIEELLHKRISRAEDRVRRIQAAPTLPIYDFSSIAPATVMAANIGSGGSSTVHTPTIISPLPIHLEFGVYIPQTTIDALLAASIAHGVGFKNWVASMYSDEIRIDNSNFSNIRQTEFRWSTQDNDNFHTTTYSSLPLVVTNIWHTIRYSIETDSTFISKLDGSTYESHIPSWGPLTGTTNFGAFSFGTLAYTYSELVGEVIYIRNVKIGTSAGASDIFTGSQTSDFPVVSSGVTDVASP